ncbi:MAG: hypothetical protein ACI8ZM_005711 [Crocinitomix sp.]|jgi:hypothetical protein
METIGLVGLFNDCFGGAPVFDQSVMNFVEVTSLLLPALLLIVLFIRMKVLAGRNILLQSYAPTDILMQEQKADHQYNGQLPFANFSVKNFHIVLALFIGILVIYLSDYYH